MTELRRYTPVEQGTGYTVIGVLEDGADLSQTLVDLKEFGLGDEGLTVVLKRPDPDEPEPFPDGIRYIVVPDDNRGLAEPIGFAVVFLVSALLFAFIVPSIGLMLFLFFASLSMILIYCSFFKVGVLPILIDMKAPPEESGFWNEEFERGKVLVFASSKRKETLRPVWGLMQERSIYFDVIGRRLVPQPLNEAVLHLAGTGGDEQLPEESQEA